VKSKKSKLKKYRCYFEVSATTFRTVNAFDEQDAREQVEGDRIYAEELEDVDLSTICVDNVEEVKPKKVKK
jgi:hypothetical protein